jgi:serine O-acetyltransferase
MIVKNIAKRIWLSLSAIRLIPHILLMEFHPSHECIVLDMERWALESFKRKKPETTWGYIRTFIALMTWLTEYRNLFYWRIGWTSIILYPLCRPKPLLDINLVDDGIGPGFIIKHGRASSVSARKIGKNCMIFQHVTIGHIKEFAKPTLGDNVTVFAGAKVLGNVKVGDNSIVGANAVVVKDVPANCTVVGVYPTYIVRRDGMKVKELL